MYDCSSDPNSVGPVEGVTDSCICIEDYEWDPDQLKCVVFCGKIDFATEIKDGTIDECLCEENFVWNMDADRCEFNCSSV